MVSHRSPSPSTGSDVELANLRAAFRWSADASDVDTAATIAAATALVGAVAHVFEPSAWAEELLEAAQAQQLRMLPWLYCGAASCMYLGRADDAVRYADASLALLDDLRFDPLPVGFGYPALSLGSAHLMAGVPDRFLANAAAVIARDGDTTGFVRAGMAWALASLGRFDEAASVLDGAVEAAEQSGIPAVIAYTLYAYGTTHAHAHPQEALAAKRRALDIARRSGSRMVAAMVTRELAGMEARFGDTSRALDLFDETIDSVHQTGTLSHLGATFAELAIHLERVGLVAAAATMYGAAIRDARSAAIFARRPELPDRLRQTLGLSAFDENRAVGTAMTAAEAVRYAHAQIAAARAFVEPV